MSALSASDTILEYSYTSAVVPRESWIDWTLWGGLDIMIDPFSGSTSGTKRVVALQDVDIAARNQVSFAVTKDILTA